MENSEGKTLYFVETELKRTHHPINVPAKIYGVEEAFPLFREQIGNKSVEQLIALYMDSGYSPVAISQVGKGSAKGIDVSISEIIRIALLSNTCYFLIAHNHPSGILKPSEKDIQLTKVLAQAGAMFQIQLIDSIIVSHSSEYYSMRTSLNKEGSESNGGKN